MTELIFPKGFTWGTSTSAYQIEGGYKEDGKGESIWDRFTHNPGNILNNDTGDTACDHYHLYKEDIKLMKEIGISSYNFSISWPRIYPDGDGKVNQKGIDFYRRLAELLIENGIKPVAKLYHWDLPQKLQDVGGWANRNIADAFEQYARTVFQALGDIIPVWMTFNEPFVSSFIGYWYGGHPPGIKEPSTALAAAHNTLLSHGKAVKAFREMGIKGEIGIALNLNPVYPATEAEIDIAAAKRYADFNNGWFLDPILKGEYPAGLVEWLSGKLALPEIKSGDMEIISEPIDFLGVNNYSSNSVLHDPQNGLLELAFANTGKPRTGSGWEIYPEGLYDLLMYLHKEYNGIKLIIDENGAAFNDVVEENGEINDTDRLGYLKEHIIQVHRALEHGANIKGYYLWSLLDNFEWNLGYTKRFGIVYVDYATQKRTIKKSGLWYRDTIKRNSVTAD